jgi:hypothetical protein
VVQELRDVIEVNIMDQHLHVLTAYFDSKFTGKRHRKLLAFSTLMTVTVLASYGRIMLCTRLVGLVLQFKLFVCKC